LALALAITVRTGRSEEQKTAGNPYSLSLRITDSAAGDAQERTCTIYALAELGEDSNLGKWIAETIPEVIEPGTWKGQGVLRYYAPKNILVVYHTPAVQTKVDGFLKNVKKSLPSVKAAKTTPGWTSAPRQKVVPAAYGVPAPLETATPVPEPRLGYAVPAPVRTPKHLFHFIIRYEGEGIIDDNVVKFLKAYYQGEKKEKNAEVISGISPAKIESAGEPLPAPTALPATDAPEDKKVDKKDNEDKGASKKDQEDK
jgi:hypothetical protein